MEISVLYVLLILPLIVCDDIINDVDNDELKGPHVCSITITEEHKILIEQQLPHSNSSERGEYRKLSEEQVENSSQTIRQCCSDYIRSRNRCVPRRNEVETSIFDVQNDKIKTIIQWSALALPLIIVTIVVIVFVCNNRFNRTETVNMINPRHLNMNNSAWLPSHKGDTVNMKYMTNEKTIMKETNSNQSKSNSSKNISGMFHQNVYRNSIDSARGSEGELPKSPTQQFGYDPMNPFQPDKTLKKQYQRLNQLVNMTPNSKELEC